MLKDLKEMFDSYKFLENAVIVITKWHMNKNEKAKRVREKLFEDQIAMSLNEELKAFTKYNPAKPLPVFFIDNIYDELQDFDQLSLESQSEYITYLQSLEYLH